MREWFRVGAQLKVALPLGKFRRTHKFFTIAKIRPEVDTFWVVAEGATSLLKFQVCELFWFEYVPNRLERVVLD